MSGVLPRPRQAGGPSASSDKATALNTTPCQRTPSFNVTSLGHLSAAQIITLELAEENTVLYSCGRKSRGAWRRGSWIISRKSRKFNSEFGVWPRVWPVQGTSGVRHCWQRAVGGRGWPFLRLPVNTNTAKWVLPPPFSGLSFPVGGSQTSWALALDS